MYRGYWVRCQSSGGGSQYLQMLGKAKVPNSKGDDRAYDIWQRFYLEQLQNGREKWEIINSTTILDVIKYYELKSYDIEEKNKAYKKIKNKK